MTKSSKAHTLHYLLLFLLATFLVASILFGSILNIYGKLWWWDDMLHCAAGILAGLVGLLLIHLLDAKYAKVISPLFVSIFVVCFSLTVSTLWELFEFGMDFFFATAMQQWDMPAGAIVMGANYHGMGLRDTMGDLIVGLVGAVVAGIIVFLVYKFKREIILDAARQSSR